ncbi:MAG: hypothetical protein RL422_240 [Bacteroidota bacterium]|jgi:predicted component of type VI protein secretion system
MSKTKKQKMELLYRICEALSPLYGELEDEKVKGQICTMIGAQIFYIGCPAESFQKISVEGKSELLNLQAAGLSKAKALQKLTKEHQTPRKIGGLELMEYMAGHKVTYEEFESKLQTYLKWNYVTKQENNNLKPFQKVGKFTTPEESYRAAGVVLTDF